MAVVLGVMALLPVAKLGVVQLQDASTLSEKGVGQRRVQETVPALRGAILDRNGVDLAVSVPREDVAISRLALTSAKVTSEEQLTDLAHELAGALGLDPDDTARTLVAAGADDDYVVLAKAVEPDRADRARKLLAARNLGGVLGTHPTSSREHPAGSSARALLGTLNADGSVTDWAGLEAAQDKVLRGHDGLRSVERARGGETIVGGERLLTAPRPGRDVTTTLDRTLQYETERYLTKGARTASAAGGIAIVGRPSTGEVLAVAGVERDPTTGDMELSGTPLAFTNAYQAGSVFKLVTVAAAYEAGVVHDDTTFTVPWRIQVKDAEFEDHDEHAVRTMNVDQIVADSSNVGTIQIGLQVGPQRLHDALSAFGFGRITGVGHPAEERGLLPDGATWTQPDLAAASIGTFQSGTVVQLWSAYNVIANGGLYVAPRLVSGTVGADGERSPTPTPEPRRVISAASAAQVDRALRMVVSEGTARTINLPGYPVAAKTGTSRMPSPKRVDPKDSYVWPDGGYHYTTTFTGYLPADRPQVSITVLLFDTPAGSSGAATAGPIFSDLARLSIRELAIAPRATDAVAPAARATAAPAAPGAAPVPSVPPTTAPARVRSVPATANTLPPATGNGSARSSGASAAGTSGSTPSGGASTTMAPDRGGAPPGGGNG
ncbi:MAG: peptidoglycan D,D-transpeptidase FtsI family protein [Microthrixaceae bacterium]